MKHKNHKNFDNIQFAVDLAEELSSKNIQMCHCDEFYNIVTNVTHILVIKIS